MCSADAQIELSWITETRRNQNAADRSQPLLYFDQQRKILDTYTAIYTLHKYIRSNSSNIWYYKKIYSIANLGQCMVQINAHVFPPPPVAKNENQ